MRSSWHALLCVALLQALPRPAGATVDVVSVHCTVFEDTDEDGSGSGEPGLAGVRVTNGVDVIPTDVAGQVDLTVDRTLYRFVTITVPAGFRTTTPWFVPVDGAVDSLDVSFGLAPDLASATDPVTWVHIADTQVDTWGDPWRMDDILEQVNRIPQVPLFLINAGDLVGVGSDSTHWNNYMEQLAVSDYEVLPVVGNHDTLGTNEPLAAYEAHMGPPYYSREAGSWHFVIYNAEAAAVGTPVQDDWMDTDVAAAPPGSHVVVCQHRMLKEATPARNQHWASLGVLANFSGHWHALQLSREPAGMLDLNLSRTRSGPLDRTPMVFGIVTMEADGRILYDLRRVHVDHRVAVTHPAENQVVATGDVLDAMVQAYDTSSPVASVVVTVSGAGGSVPGTSLVREGISLWRAEADVSSLPAGVYGLSAVVTYDDGEVRNVYRTFRIDDVIPLVRAAGGDWPMFRKCAAGSSYTAQPLEPPLELAWSRPVPGMVALSSPVVADGKVYLGTRAEHEVGEEGVFAFDAATGAPIWAQHVPGGVSLAPAVAGGVVIASAMSDSTWGLDAETGALLWNSAIQGARYNMTAPVFEGLKAWVGPEPKPTQVTWATGAVDWLTPWLGDPWFPYIYSAPAVGASYVYYGFYGVDLPGGGLSVVNRTNGTRLSLEIGAFRSPIWTGQTLYVVGAPNRNAQRLTARDGTGVVQWTSPWDLGGGTGSPALGNGVVVVAGASGAIEGLRAADGAHLWTHPVGYELFQMASGLKWARGTSATPAIADSVVWIGSLDGYLYALDVATGAERWKWFAGVPIASSAAVSGNMLFVGASDGHLYAFASPSAVVTGVPPEREGRASTLQLFPVRPNPSAGPSVIAWTQTRRGRAQLDLYDVSGRHVRRLLDTTRDAGEHEVRWDGRAAGGERVADGLYFVRLRTDEGERLEKLVRLVR